MVHAQPRRAVIAKHAAKHTSGKVIAHRGLNHLLHRNAARGQEIRNIGCIVHAQRHGNEEHQAAAQGDQQPCRICARRHGQFALLRMGFAQLVVDLLLAGFIRLQLMRSRQMLTGPAPHAPEEQHRQAHARIAARPLAGHSQAHKQAGQRQRNQRFNQRFTPVIHAQIVHHKHIRPDDKQHHKAVDGRNARLGKMHTVHRHQEHGGKRAHAALGQELAKQIHARQHQYARQRPGKAPAKGRHAKDRNGESDQHLAQRRMRGFIGAIGIITLHSQIMLIPRAGMIDFIKVGAVIPARLAGECILLVNQRFAVAAYQRHGENLLRSRIAEDGLVNRGADILRLDAHIAARQRQWRCAVGAVAAAIVGLAQIIPLEAVVAIFAAQLGPVGLAPGFTILAYAHDEIAVHAVDARHVQHVELPGFAQIQHHVLMLIVGVCGSPAGLRGFGRAQVGKGNNSVNHRHTQHQRVIQPNHPGKRFRLQHTAHGSAGPHARLRHILGLFRRRGRKQHVLSLAAYGRAHIARPAGQRAVQRRYRVFQPGGIADNAKQRRAQMPAGAADAHAAIQDNAHVQEHAQAQQYKQDIHTAVAFQQAGQRQQHSGREKIALVHHGTHAAQQHQQQRAQQRQVANTAPRQVHQRAQHHGQGNDRPAKGRVAHGTERADQPRQQQSRSNGQIGAMRAIPAEAHGGKGRAAAQAHHTQQANQHRRAFLHAHPVLPEQEIQVAGVHRGAGIVGHGAGIQADQPARLGLIDGEGDHHRQRNHRRASQTNQGLPHQHAVTIADPFHNQRQQAQRAKHQRLGLHQHRQHINWQRPGPLALNRQHHHQQDAQRHHAVRLSPGSTGNKGKGIQGIQRSHREGGALRNTLAAIGIQHGRRRNIAQDGGHLDQQGSHARAQQLADLPKQPQHQQVSGGIITESRGVIEIGRAYLYHGIGPGAKAANIHAIARHQYGHKDAGCKGRRQQGQQHPEGWALQHPLPQRCAAKQQANQRIAQRHGQQIGPGRGGSLLVRCGRSIGCRARPARSNIAVWHTGYLLQRDIPEGSRADGLTAVAAQAGKDRYAPLAFPCAAIQAHLLPFALGIIHALGKHVDARDGQVGAQAIAGVSANIAAQAVQAVGLHRNFLHKARVVQGMVGNGRHAVGHTVIGISGHGDVRIGIPVLHIGGKIAVHQQITGLNLALFAWQRQRQHQGDHRNRGKRNDPQQSFLFHHTLLFG